MKKICLSILFIYTVNIGSLFANEFHSLKATASKPIKKYHQLNIYSFNIEKKYFDFIVERKKNIEGRVNMPDVTNLKIGDLVSFRDEEGKNIICNVTSVSKYPNFTSMLVSEGVKNMLPNIDSDSSSTPKMIAKGVKIYQSFPGYSEDVKKYGAIAFGIQCIDTVYRGDPNIIQIKDD